jgi:hypothetical protein
MRILLDGREWQSLQPRTPWTLAACLRGIDRNALAVAGSHSRLAVAGEAAFILFERVGLGLSKLAGTDEK